MTWCPKCRIQYSDETQTCTNCGGELMDEVPTDDELITDVEWVPIAQDINPVRARMLKDDLESAGIPVVITGTSMVSFHVYPSTENAILVPRRWADEAKQIFEDFMASDDGAVDQTICSNCGAVVDEGADKCPECGEVFDESDAEE